MKNSLHASFCIPLLLLLVSLLCFPSSARAQTGDAEETIRVDADLVDLNAIVISHDSRKPVVQLEQKDFAVFENGAPQEIAYFASAATPFDLVLLIDLSGSTADKLDLVRRSARRFVKAARPADRIGIVTFTNEPRLVSPLTSDRAELLKRIKKIERPEGGTSFWDALRYVLERVLSPATPARRSAIVVMTDGIDNALPDVIGDGSVTSFDELLEVVRRSDAIVIPVYLDTEREMVRLLRATETSYLIARQQLAQLAAESGSTVYQARKLEDLKGIYEQVIHDLGTVYSLGYRPTTKRSKGAWRTVTVRLPMHPDLAVRTKRGYYAN